MSNFFYFIVYKREKLELKGNMKRNPLRLFNQKKHSDIKYPCYHYESI